jgi:hypothetical protein
MDQQPRHAQRGEAGELQRRRMQPQLVRRKRHHARGKRGIGKRRDVHLPRGDDEAGVDRQQQQEIHLARADQLGQVRAVDEEERLVKLLDEIARARQQHHLPHRPSADGFGLGKNDADKAQLQPNQSSSTRIQSRKLPLNDISRVTEVRHNAP